MAETILLVDDEEDIRLVLSVALADMGFDVITANSGKTGIQLFREHRPPIVVTDIKMPDIDGVDLLRLMKTEDPDVEVVMITGHGDMNTAIRSFQNEATDFINKPIDVKTLEKAIFRVRDKIRARDQGRLYTSNLERMLCDKIEAVKRLGKARPETGGMSARMFDDLPSPVAMIDAEYVIRDTNLPFQEEFGNVTETRCYQALKNRDGPCPDCRLSETLEGGQSVHWQTSISKPSGKSRDMLVWASPVSGGVQGRGGALALYTDLFQLLDFQDNLASLGLMMGSVSHTIKGMLTSLDGGMYLLDSGLKSDDGERVAEGLSLVKQMVGNIRNTVLDVLLFSKERDLNKEPLPVHGFTESLAATVSPKIRQAGVSFRLENPDSSARMLADPDFLTTAFVNILENALEACLEDAESAEGREKFVRLAVTVGPESAEFFIEDNGKGMDEEVCKKLFELFFSTKGRKGTGLGLYITKRTITQHGGTITVESTPGSGSCFTVRLPLLEAAA